MPDLTKRTSNRRKNLQKLYRSKEWKEATKAFKEKHPYCEWHLKYDIEIPTFVPHHPFRDTYAYPELYIDLEKSGCIAMCRRCHAAVDHNLDICPVCKEGYKPYEADMCGKCKDKADPERVRLREVAKIRKKKAQKEYRAAQYQKQKASREKYLKEKNKGNV